MLDDMFERKPRFFSINGNGQSRQNLTEQSSTDSIQRSAQMQGTPWLCIYLHQILLFTYVAIRLIQLHMRIISDFVVITLFNNKTNVHLPQVGHTRLLLNCRMFRCLSFSTTWINRRNCKGITTTSHKNNKCSMVKEYCCTIKYFGKISDHQAPALAELRLECPSSSLQFK